MISSQAIQYLSSDGKLTPANVQAVNFSVSPDRLKWIAFGANIQIFSDDGSLLRTVDLPAALDPKNISSIIWRPDSSGLFFTYGDPLAANVPSQLFALELSQGVPVQVDQFSSPSPKISSGWLARGNRNSKPFISRILRITFHIFVFTFIFSSLLPSILF